jgi:positive regulator of sigma E activity
MGSRIDYASGQGLVRCQSHAICDRCPARCQTTLERLDVREEIVAAYAMATIKTGALTLVPGVRMEHTVDKAFAKIVTPRPR